ncbi:MAG: DUF4421 family protein, partial [Flavihumibacter sp.]
MRLHNTFLLLGWFCVLPFTGWGQEKKPVNSAYITGNDSLLVGRFYFSQKYTSFRLRTGAQQLYYRPNTTLNVGVGATYRWLSLNIAVPAPGLNKNDDRGKTKYLDLQAHAYPRNWTIDFYGQNYRG